MNCGTHPSKCTRLANCDGNHEPLGKSRSCNCPRLHKRQEHCVKFHKAWGKTRNCRVVDHAPPVRPSQIRKCPQRVGPRQRAALPHFAAPLSLRSRSGQAGATRDQRQSPGRRRLPAGKAGVGISGTRGARVPAPLQPGPAAALGPVPVIKWRRNPDAGASCLQAAARGAGQRRRRAWQETDRAAARYSGTGVPAGGIKSRLTSPVKIPILGKLLTAIGGSSGERRRRFHLRIYRFTQ